MVELSRYSLRPFEKRHYFLEAKDAIKTAEEFVEKILKLIRKEFPQKEFDF